MPRHPWVGSLLARAAVEKARCRNARDRAFHMDTIGARRYPRSRPKDGSPRPMLASPCRLRAMSVAGLFVTIASLASSGARAQDASSAAAAEALFREGRQLMDARRYGEACAKFQASYELDVALGTLLNLANCYELDGQLASAWARFVEAETTARRAGDQRGTVARDRAAALEPRLVRVRVIVGHPVDGLRVVVGGREFAPALYGSAIPIDPGEVTLTASAPRHEPYTRTFEATEEGTTVDVEVPALVPSPETISEDPPPDVGLSAPPRHAPEESGGSAV